MTDQPTLLTNLRTALGDAHVLTTGDLSAWEMDWRKRERGRALAVVRPGSTAEVAAVVKACAGTRSEAGRTPSKRSQASRTANSPRCATSTPRRPLSAMSTRRSPPSSTKS
jgi:hypothetical protein